MVPTGAETRTALRIVRRDQKGTGTLISAEVLLFGTVELLGMVAIGAEVPTILTHGV